MKHLLLQAAILIAEIASASGCNSSPKALDEAPMPGSASSFDAIVAHLKKHADAVVLEGDGGSRVLVSRASRGASSP